MSTKIEIISKLRKITRANGATENEERTAAEKIGKLIMTSPDVRVSDDRQSSHPHAAEQKRPQQEAEANPSYTAKTYYHAQAQSFDHAAYAAWTQEQIRNQEARRVYAEWMRQAMANAANTVNAEHEEVLRREAEARREMLERMAKESERIEKEKKAKHWWSPFT